MSLRKESSGSGQSRPSTNEGFVSMDSGQARENVAKASEQRSVGELFATVTSQFSSLVHDEIEYTKKSYKHKILNLGKGGVLLAVAGVLSLFMFGFILHTIAAAFKALWWGHWWAGYLSVAVILLVFILILAGVGIAMLKKSGTYKTDFAGNMSENVDSVKKGLAK